MSETALLRLLAGLIGAAGVALGVVSWVHGWTLFLSPAAVLVLLAAWIQIVAWSLRSNRRT